MKNKMTDLNNHLFEQLERLNDDELTEQQLDQEIKRAKAMSNIAMNIINNGNLVLKAKQHTDEYGSRDSMPDFLQLDSK